MIQREPDLTPAVREATRPSAQRPPRLAAIDMPAPPPAPSRTNARTAQTALGRVLARAVLQRLEVTPQNRAEVNEIKGRYLAAHPNDYTGWTALLKASSLEFLRAQYPAPTPVPTVVQPRGPIVDERPGRAAVLTTTDGDRTIGPFGNPGKKLKAAKGPCYYNDGGDYCISPDRDGHAGDDCWKLFTQVATAGRGEGWTRVDTLFADGRRMNRG